MIEKLRETVKVETYLTRVRCPNKECVGSLVFDGKSRTEGMLHGGTPEYRHRCSTCNLGAWLGEQYPKVSYRDVPVVQVSQAEAPAIGEQVVALIPSDEGANVVR